MAAEGVQPTFQEQVTNFTLAEINAAIALLPPPVLVQPPSPVQSLASYVLTYGSGRTIAAIMVALGYDPFLAARVDQRLQVMPSDAVTRLAAFLIRPRAEVVWACGGRELRAQAPGLGRRFA